jgi:hypothetical protein
MSLHNKQFNDSEAKFIWDIFNILEFNKNDFEFVVGRTNIIGGEPSPEWGILDGNTIGNFYPATELLNRWFLQDIIKYMTRMFQTFEGEVIPRVPSLLPYEGYSLKDIRRDMVSYEFGQYSWYVKTLKKLYGNDPDVGEMVQELEVPTSDTTAL